MNFDIELVGKIGSMALINKESNILDYTLIARLSQELKPGYIWVTSGAAETGRLDYIKRNGKELDISPEDWQLLLQAIFKEDEI
jgi:glutamate 5-kinase